MHLGRTDAMISCDNREAYRATRVVGVFVVSARNSFHAVSTRVSGLARFTYRSTRSGWWFHIPLCRIFHAFPRRVLSCGAILARRGTSLSVRVCAVLWLLCTTRTHAALWTYFGSTRVLTIIASDNRETDWIPSALCVLTFRTGTTL